MKSRRYNGNVSQYGWAFGDEVEECTYNGCHSQVLAYTQFGTPTQAWSFGPNIPKMRLDYIFDPRVSPWRSLLPTFGMTRQDIEDGSPFIYNDLTLDANILVNHMVSVRWPSEQIWSYHLWERLVHRSVHPAVADLLTAMCRARECQKRGPYDPDHPEFTTFQYMHSNFIALDCDMEYADNFVRGVLAGGNGFPFVEAKHVDNDYAGGSVPRGYKPIVGAFGHFEEVSYLDQMKGIPGAFQRHLVDTYGELRSFDHLVAMGLSEQKRFNLDDWDQTQQLSAQHTLEAPGGVEYSPEAVAEYEKRRQGVSHWAYVQQLRGGFAHAF